MINLFKFGLIGGFVNSLIFMMFCFIFIIPFLYTFDVFVQSNTWHVFYENWLWNDLIVYERKALFNFKAWRFYIFVFILGFVAYFWLAFLKSKSDFS